MRASAIMETMEEVIFWLEVIWTPGLALTAFLLLPRPVDALQHDKIFCEQGLEGRAMAVVEIDGGPSSSWFSEPGR
jgi:hypothetical protein